MLVVGDSFAGALKLIPNINVKVFGGATAAGLSNTDSKSGAGAEIKKLIKNNDKIVFVFGTVDIVIKFYYKLTLGIELDIVKYIKDTVEKYDNYLRSVNKTIYVASVFPSVVKPQYFAKSLSFYIFRGDNEDKINKIADKSVFTMKFRINAVAMMNYALKQLCIKRGYIFVDIFSDITVNGRLKPEYVDNTSTHNIHVLWEPTIKYWCKRLNLPLPANLNVSLEHWQTQKRKDMKKILAERGINYF